MTPPPIASPEPEYDGTSTPSGVYRAVEKKFRGEKIFNLAVAGVALLISLGTLIGGYNHIISEARAQADAGVQPIDRRVTILEQQQVQTRQDVHEVQVDIRSLYKAVMTGERQNRLEQPAPIPKPADGGL